MNAMLRPDSVRRSDLLGLPVGCDRSATTSLLRHRAGRTVPVGAGASGTVSARTGAIDGGQCDAGWGVGHRDGEAAGPDLHAAETKGADEAMSDDRWRSTYDDWKTRSDDPGTVGRTARGIAYACLDCDWRGSGGVKAFEHHRDSRHHRIIVRDAPQMGPLPFGCCSELGGESK